MKRILFSCCLLSIALVGCSRAKDRKFIQPYAFVPQTSYHSSSVGQVLETIAAIELGKCTAGCEAIQADLTRYRKSERAFHKILPAVSAARAIGAPTALSFPRGCPCASPISGDSSCIWSITSMYTFINDNNTFSVSDFHIEDMQNNTVARVGKELVSPSGRYSVYQMSGIDTFSRDRLLVSITLQGMPPRKLPVIITQTAPGP